MTDKSNTQAAEVAVIPRVWRNTLRKLAFMAGTSGGTAGPDQGLKDALKEAMDLLDGPYRYADAIQPTPVGAQALDDEAAKAIAQNWCDSENYHDGMTGGLRLRFKITAERMPHFLKAVLGQFALPAQPTPEPLAQAENVTVTSPSGSRWEVDPKWAPALQAALDGRREPVAQAFDIDGARAFLASFANWKPDPLDDDRYSRALATALDYLEDLIGPHATPLSVPSLTFEQIEDCLPEGLSLNRDESMSVSAQQMHDFARKLLSSAPSPVALQGRDGENIEAMQAVEALDAWIFKGCPGGPWRGLEHVGVLKQHFALVPQLKASAEALEDADRNLRAKLKEKSPDAARASLPAGGVVEPGMLEQHHRDSAELRRLCQARDDARRERDAARAEISGLSSSVGHLSVMVDGQTRLVQKAVAIMKALHESATPDDGPDMNAIIPAGAFRVFVDGHAELMHALHIGPQITTPQPSETQGRRQMTRKQVDDLMTKHFPLDSLIKESVDIFEQAVRDVEAHHGIPASPQDGGA